MNPEQFVQELNKAINDFARERNKRTGDMPHFTKTYLKASFADPEFVKVMEKFFHSAFSESKESFGERMKKAKAAKKGGVESGEE